MQTLTRDQLESVKARWREVTYGTTVKILYWPMVQFGSSIAALVPTVTARSLDATIVQPEGSEPPYLAGEEPAGEVTLSREEFMALPGAAEFWSALIAAFDEKLLAQQAPPPAEPPPEPVP